MRMHLKKIILNVTDDCNFNCIYCYQRNTKSGLKMSWETCKNALDYYFNHSGKNISIDFSGGEPLLNIDIIKKAVEYSNIKSEILKKKTRFSIITNGSLVTNKTLVFLNENRFDVQFSFDSILQNKQRKSGSFKQSLILLEKFTESKNITLSITPVFTSKAVDKIFKSIMFLKNRYVKNILMGLDLTKRWNIQSRIKLKKELNDLKKEEIKDYLRTGKISLNIFSDRESEGISGCSAGDSQISVSPSGDLWGCPSFTHLNWNRVETERAGDYFYGNINNPKTEILENNYKHILNNYKDFTTDNYFTSKSKCFLCPYLQECRLCPAINKYSGLGKKSLFFIPEYICEINKIIINVNHEFIKVIKRNRIKF